MTNVKRYADKRLLERVEFIGGKIPSRGKYLIIGVQSQEDEFNAFDDKFYVFFGLISKQVSTGTTDAGKEALNFFENYDLTGAAVCKADQWCPNVYSRGYHRADRADGGMRTLKQRKSISYFRDNNRDQNIDEIEEPYNNIIWLNIHGVDYNPYSKVTREFMNKRSFGCQIWNRMGDYRQMINAVWKRNKAVDYALLREFQITEMSENIFK